MSLEHTLERDTPPQRLVVIGAAGFVGRAVVAAGRARGLHVLPITRAEIDLLAPAAAVQLAGLLQPDDCVVAASAIAPCKNADMLVQNIALVWTLVQALRSRPVSHVVNISSDAIYGDSPERLTERSAAAPGSMHGVMHVAREAMLLDGTSCPVGMLRPTLIHGPGDPHNGYGPNRFRRNVLRREPIRLFGEGEERRDHIYIDDVAALCLAMVLRRSRGALNAATGEVRSFAQVARDTVRLSGRDSPIERMPRTGPMPHNGYRAFDTSAIASAFPAFRFTPWEDALASALRSETTGYP